MKRTLAHLFLPAIALTLACTTKAASLGDPAAPLEIAEWIKGDAVDLAEAKGTKVIVVEFWATWCGPCKVSIPHLTEMQKKYANRGVVIYGPYRYMRHPMYFGYLLNHIGLFLLRPTDFNLAIYVIAWSMQITRLLAEERHRVRRIVAEHQAVFAASAHVHLARA